MKVIPYRPVNKELNFNNKHKEIDFSYFLSRDDISAPFFAEQACTEISGVPNPSPSKSSKNHFVRLRRSVHPVVQRFSSSLNLNVHLHALMMYGLHTHQSTTG